MKRTPKGATASTAKPVLKLVKVTPIRRKIDPVAKDSQDTIEFLESMLRQARMGEVDGLAVAISYSDGTFDTKTIGRAEGRPVVTIGVLESFKAELLVEMDEGRR